MSSPPPSALTTESPAYAVRPMPPSGPRYHWAGVVAVSSTLSVPSPLICTAAASTTAYSRQPWECQTVSPTENPGACDSTTSPTVRMPSIGACRAKEAK